MGTETRELGSWGLGLTVPALPRTHPVALDEPLDTVPFKQTVLSPSSMW